MLARADAPGGAESTVLIVSYDFPPAIEVGARAVAQIGRYLPEYGWRPVVLAAKERHFRQIDPSTVLSFPGPVIRTRVLPNPIWFYAAIRAHLPQGANGKGDESSGVDRSGTIRRWILSMLFTPDAQTGWLLPAVTRGLRLIRERRIDHIFSSAPWWTNHLVAYVLARRTGLSWTVQFRDPWTQVPQWKAVSRASLWIERELEKLVVNNATRVCCVTERHSELLRRSFAERSPKHFVTIPNGFDAEEWEALDAEPRARAERFTITYTGDFWQQRNPLPVFRAVKALMESGVVARDRVRIELIGSCEVTAGGRSVRELASECGVSDCVEIVARLERRQALSRMVRSHLLLVLAEGWTLQIPQKTYEYMRSGSPVLALSSDGALRDLLEGLEGAWVVDPVDDAGIRQVIEVLYRRWVAGAPAPGVDPKVVAPFDRRLLAGRFARLFEEGRFAGATH